jgi:hypothetical protein
VYGLKYVWIADVVEAANFFGAEILNANSNLVPKFADDRSERSTINRLPHEKVTDV